MSQIEESTKPTGNLDHESPDFASYRKLGGAAKVAELSQRTTVFILPIVVLIVDQSLSDIVAKYEEWVDLYSRVFYLVLSLSILRCVWKLVLGVMFVRRYRYKFDESGIHVRFGVWTQQHSTVPRNRIQHVNVSQGIIQRNHGLATLSFMTAGTAGLGTSVRHVPIELANRIREEIIEEANSR